MSNNELNNKISGIFVAVLGCLSLINPLNTDVSYNYNVAGSVIAHDKENAKEQSVDIYSEMLNLVQMLTSLVAVTSRLNIELINGDEDVYRAIKENNKFPNMVSAITSILSDVNSISSSELLDDKDTKILEFISLGLKEARYNASCIAKAIKQNTFTPSYFDSEVTDDDLRSISEHAASISLKYS